MAASARLLPGQWERMWPIYVPLGYCPPVEELAKGVLYLASDLSATVTGSTLHVDGGTFAASGFHNWPYDVGYLPCPQGDAPQRRTQKEARIFAQQGAHMGMIAAGCWASRPPFDLRILI